MKKKKMLLFHPALAPYRVDQFNMLNELFDLEVVFLFDNLWTFKLDQELLLSQCSFKISYLLKGIRSKGRVFRFGMYQKIKQSQPDIILSYEYSFSTQYLLLLKQLGLIKQTIGSMIDDSIDMCYNIQSKVRFKARRQTIKHLDFLVLMSDEVSQYYQTEFHFDETKIIVSPILQIPEKLRMDTNNLELVANRYVEQYNLKNKKVLLFVGRLIPEKALPLFVTNIYSVLQNENNLMFVIVGEGRERILLEDLIIELKLDDKIILTGKFEGVELHGWYLCASGFVLPSIFEPFGAVVNEALIFGVPVFCSTHAGSSSLINSDNGMIFDPKNRNETIENLKLFLNRMKVLDRINLSSKPSLMEDFKDSFNIEWRKLI